MDVVFVYDMDKLRLNKEVNGTMLLATKLLQAKFSVKIYRFAQNPEYGQKQVYSRDYGKFIDTAVKQILEYDPKVVSFYALWPSYHIILRLACEIKRKAPQVVTVLGGPQASLTAEESMRIADYVDYICTGEGENTIVPFVQSVLRNNCTDIDKIPGLYYRRNEEICFNSSSVPLTDLETLPYWDERLYCEDYQEPPEALQSDYYYMPIDVGRGCPFGCTFCCSSRFWQRTYRLKSAERIVADVEYYYQKYGIRSFWFTHDAFTVNKRNVDNVCNLILERKLDIIWRCTTRVDCITEELILKMKKAGMRGVELGIETGSERMQKLTNKRLKLDNTKNMVQFLLRNGIEVIPFFMYGFPDEKEDDLQQTLDLYFSMLELGVKKSTMSFCQFNPATEITKKYGNKLRFAPEMGILSRGVFGFTEENEMIRKNKTIFPFFYHLDSTVRNEYQYMYYLADLYQKYPNSAKQLRRLYHGDDLKFYREFVGQNQKYFGTNIMEIWEGITKNSKEMLSSIADSFSERYIPQLKALIEFDFDYQTLLKSNGEESIQKRYDFNFLEFQMNLPIEQYSDGWTELLMKKKDKKVLVRVINIS